MESTIVSALGAIPKPDTETIRLIRDCSRPQFSNVNSYATTQHFCYVTVEKAVLKIKPNAYLTKIDLKSAYRHVPIHSSNYCATGLAWQFQEDQHVTYLYDNKLPFGVSQINTSCYAHDAPMRISDNPRVSWWFSYHWRYQARVRIGLLRTH